MTTESKYPEHEKLAKVKDKSQIIGAFLDNGLPDGVVFAEWNRHRDVLYPVRCDIQQWLADYFDIDRDKLEAEKQQMLDEIRAVNQ
jgi:hypothetical protein